MAKARLKPRFFSLAVPTSYMIDFPSLVNGSSASTSKSSFVAKRASCNSKSNAPNMHSTVPASLKHAVFLALVISDPDVCRFVVSKAGEQKRTDGGAETQEDREWLKVSVRRDEKRHRVLGARE